MDEASQIILVILTTLICSAFFSGMEIAFVSANRLKIELDKKQGLASGKILAYFVKNTPSFISAMLLGNNVSLVIYGIFMAILLEPLLTMISTSTALVLLMQTVISTLIVLVTAEFLPKAIFRINPNRTLRMAILPLVVIYGILYVPTQFTMFISKLFLKLFRVDLSASEQAFTKVDLDHYVRDISERIEEKGELENELQILQNALEFPNVKVRDCMIPRTEMVALNLEAEIKVLKDKFIETGLSKILIYRDSIDHIIGYVHAHELFSKPESIKQILLPISIVPEAMLVQKLLEQLTKSKRSMAVVVDEFGGTSGLITIEDVIEEIFGDIQDEHDKEEEREEEIEKDVWLFSGRLDIDYLKEEYDLPLEDSPEYDTLAGYVIHKLEDIPTINTTVETDKLQLTVVEVSENKIDLVKVKKRND